MHTYAYFYAIFSILSALISLIAAIMAWRRSAPGSLMLSLLLVSMAIWSGFYSTRWINISLAAKVFCFKIMFIGVLALPTLFLLFVLAFTHHDRWLTTRNLFLLTIQPAVCLLLHWTNEYHYLYYSSIKVSQEQGFITMELLRGPWYFGNIVYSYLIIGVGFLLLSQGALRASPLHLNQYRLLLIGSILPWAGSFYSEFHFVKLKGLDLAPLLFGFSGMLFALAVFRTRFMDLIPVARSYLIENMSDGLLVLDEQNRILDINPAMGNFLENKVSSYLGENAYEVFAEWMEQIDFLEEQIETRIELKVPKDPSRYLDLRVTPLYDRTGSLNGRLMIFRDITERKQVEKRLRYVNDRQQSQLIEIGLLQSKLREQAIRDPLTNLFNRRYLEETLDHEIARASREGYSICIMMIDLDHFKKVNDTYGHEAGDHVLRATATTLSVETRGGDFACRYGGEEFVIVMPNMDSRVAYERAEKLRNTLNSLYIPYGIYTLTITISMGIACYPANGLSREAILRAADKAMYAAKEAGRDHILSYDQIQVSEEALDD
jgi:diguanylate cyclase (GGDEF)-like protein/PAS domain S-box-containing protein